MDCIIFLGCLGAIILFIGIIMEFYDSDNGNWFIAYILAFTLFIVITIIAYTTDKPTAIDVYRGNTTLEITYKDSIPIDTVVVYKNK